ELRPESLEQEGLAAALRKYAAAREARDGLTVEIVAEDERRLAPQHEEAAYRIVREALHNVVKHARARRARVRLRFRPAALELEVHDDGQGFDVSAMRSGLGLTSMRERAEQLGGSLDVQSSPGRGTTVSARLPVGADA